jgi:hypothetical protein
MGSKFDVVLGEDGFQPEGQMFLRMKTGDLPCGRVEDHIQGLALGLTLHG